MSDLSDALEEAFDAAEEATGERRKVTFRGQSLDALIQTDTDNFQPVAGGWADTSQVKLSLRLRDVSMPIEDLEPIIVHGTRLAILSFARLEGRLDITAGDPAAEME